MGKNIVICCDGTANEFARNNTNVVKLYSVIEHDTPAQVTYYHPGIGTMEPPGALSPLGRRLTKVLGLAIGWGLSDDIRAAYLFLMQNWQPGDKVYLFGFSRGAYTVRAVAALLKGYGLLRPGNDGLVPYAIRMMTGFSRARKNEKDKAFVNEYFSLERGFRDTLSRKDCRPYFVGVWDTVSSVGWVENPLKLPYVTANADIEIGRHAIAIDEHRAFFRNHLWRPGSTASSAGPKDLMQVWFPGVHCDVGGGYPESESGLSKHALDWMLQEAKFAGLRVLPEREREVLGGGENYTAPDADGPMHESLTWKWWLAEFVPKRHYDFKTGKQGRRMNLFRRRTMPPGCMVHESAFLRQTGVYVKKLPPDIVRVATRRLPLTASAK